MEPQNLVLILARDLADKLASAMFLIDHEGRLVYFNERAAEILGQSFGEVGRLPLEEWASAFNPTDFEDRPLDPEDLPLVVALSRHEPDHRPFRITGGDGKKRDLAVTAFPLFARADEFVGAAAIFWEQPSKGGDQA